jgi:hypothetical protein
MYIHICIHLLTHICVMYISMPCVCVMFHYLSVVASCHVCDLPIHNTLSVSEPCSW